MKKIIAMLLAFVMLFALSAAAMADEAPVGNENPVSKSLSFMSAWRGIVKAGNLNGDFVKVGDLEVDLWMPDVLTAQSELPDDAYFLYADSTGNASIKAHRVGLDGASTLEEVEKNVTDAGCVSDGIYWINGFNALVFESKENDSINVVILRNDDDTGVEFVFKGVSNQDMYSLSSLVMATIQRHTLDLQDVGTMMSNDLYNNWGPGYHITSEAVKDSDDIRLVINLWKDGVNADSLSSVTGWDSLKDDLTSLYELYADVLARFGMDDIELAINFTDENDEASSFLTIENDEITYDVAAQ